MTQCKHHQNGRCTNTVALLINGEQPGSNPSPGTCYLSCVSYDGPTEAREAHVRAILAPSSHESAPRKQESAPCAGCNKSWPEKMARFATGAVKLTKYAFKADMATDEQIASRHETCVGCEHYDFGVCGECGCLLPAKVRLAGESCPLGKWST